MGFDMSAAQFNIIKRRGDPDNAITLSGHQVEKQEFVYFKLPEDVGSLKAGTWVTMRCADYHNEHFVYIDPKYHQEGTEGLGHWFAMCTCGSPAVIIDPSTTALHGDSDVKENMLVCYIYMLNMDSYGVGAHVGQERRAWR